MASHQAYSLDSLYFNHTSTGSVSPVVLHTVTIVAHALYHVLHSVYITFNHLGLVISGKPKCLYNKLVFIRVPLNLLPESQLGTKIQGTPNKRVKHQFLIPNRLDECLHIIKFN